VSGSVLLRSVSKEALLKRLDELHELVPLEKFLVMKLGQYADDEGCAAVKIEILAGHMNVSERTVQNKLRSLEANGVICKTGDFRVVGKRAPRRLPVYELLPGEVFKTSPSPALRKGRESAARAVLSGANSSGEAPSPEGPSPEPGFTRMGEAACTPHNERRGPNESANALSGAREGEAEFGSLFAAWSQDAPTAVARPRDRAAWQVAIEVVAPAKLLAAGIRYLAHCRANGERPYSLSAWLRDERFEPWLRPARQLSMPFDREEHAREAAQRIARLKESQGLGTGVQTDRE
jgi:hypothetical protein